jgi:Zn-finger protein
MCPVKTELEWETGRIVTVFLANEVRSCKDCHVTVAMTRAGAEQLAEELLYMARMLESDDEPHGGPVSLQERRDRRREDQLIEQLRMDGFLD